MRLIPSFGLLWCPLIFAARLAELPSVSVQSGSYSESNGDATGAETSVSVNLTNLLPIAQTVQVDVKEGVHFNIFTRNPPTGDWNRSLVDASGIYVASHSFDYARTDNPKTVQISPYSSTSVPFRAACSFLKKSVPCNFSNNYPATKAEFDGIGRITFTVSAVLQATGERAGILASVYASCNLTGVLDQDIQAVNIPLNGGRPF